MKTFKRICIKNIQHPEEGVLCKRGQEYTTSIEKNGNLVVFTKLWIKVPAKYFAGKEEFTN